MVGHTQQCIQRARGANEGGGTFGPLSDSGGVHAANGPLALGLALGTRRARKRCAIAWGHQKSTKVSAVNLHVCR